MHCGVISILQIPSTEHGVVHECSSLEAQVNIISFPSGGRSERTRKGDSHQAISRASGLRCTTVGTIGKREGRVCFRTRELCAPHF
jgi:hypothetical protein